MKILTIIFNALLFGLACLGLLAGGNSNYAVFKLFLLLVTLINLILMLGSRVSYKRGMLKIGKTSDKQESTGQSTKYLYIKIAVALLNLILLVMMYYIIKRHLYMGSLSVYLKSFVILTSVLSMVTIILGRPNGFKDLKRTLILSATGVGTIIIGLVVVILILIRQGVQERIDIAKKEYPGIAEDALIAYLSDPVHTPSERTDVAIWTLGQIRSQKALPLLKALYKEDPEGATCKYHHDTELCQYEIHKAIVNIEHKWLGDKQKNFFGSAANLNK
jgi:hypothetical protein